MSSQSWWLDNIAKIIMVCLTASFLFSRKDEQSQPKDIRQRITISESKELTKYRQNENQQRNLQLKKLLNTTGLSNLVHQPSNLLTHLRSNLLTYIHLQGY